MSGAQAMAMEDAALAEAGPAATPLSTEAAAELYRPVTTSPNGGSGRHALLTQETTPLAAVVATNGNGNGNNNGQANGHYAPGPMPGREPAPAAYPVTYPAAVPVERATQTVDNGPAVYGTVARADGLGLPQVVITVADPAGRQEARTTTAQDGFYRVDLRTGGTFLVVAAGGTYQPHAAMVAVGGTPTRHDVALSGASAVVGTVRMGDPATGSRTVAGAAVTLIDVRGDVAAARVSDADGRFQLVGVPDGSYTLTAASPGHQPVAVSVRLDVGATVECDLELPQRSRLLGTVTAASNGRGVPEAIATLVDGTGMVVGSTVTGPDGSFAFEDLAEGTYTLTASGYAPVAQMVHITAGAQASAVVELGAPNPAPAPAAEPLFEPFDTGGVR
jgi:hypothetical protein